MYQLLPKQRGFLSRKESSVIAERKQFSLILGHAITVHKSQGSTLVYMQDDLNRSTGKKTATGKNYQQPISQHQFYTLLSRAKNCDKVFLFNFEPEDVKVNELTLDEVVRMRNKSLFFWQHPLIELDGISMCLFIIRSWNVHLEHFLSDKTYSSYSNLFCFTETNTNDSRAKHIDEILDDGNDIHKNTHHGLALCYNSSEILSVLEVLPVVLEIERETILLVIVYHMPSPLGSFMDDFISLINELPTQHRMLVVGDFNLDQMLPEHFAKANLLIQNFNLS